MSGRPSRTYEFRGEQKTVKEIAALTGHAVQHVYRSIDGGKVVEKDCTKPHSNWPTYTYQGTTDTLAGWARRIGISRTTLRCRLAQYGWSLKRALTEPAMNSAQRKHPWTYIDPVRPQRETRQ